MKGVSTYLVQTSKKGIYYQNELQKDGDSLCEGVRAAPSLGEPPPHYLRYELFQHRLKGAVTVIGSKSFKETGRTIGLKFLKRQVRILVGRTVLAAIESLLERSRCLGNLRLERESLKNGGTD